MARLANEWTLGARVHWAIKTEQIAHDDRVARRGIEWRVARDAGDADQIGMARRHDDGHRVIVARIAVENDRKPVRRHG